MAWILFVSPICCYMGRFHCECEWRKTKDESSQFRYNESTYKIGMRVSSNFKNQFGIHVSFIQWVNTEHGQYIPLFNWYLLSFFLSFFLCLFCLRVVQNSKMKLFDFRITPDYENMCNNMPTDLIILQRE